VPIIFVTETSSEDVVLRAFKYGAREYFKRPFDPVEFRETAGKILRFKRGVYDKRLSLPEAGEERLPAGHPVSAEIPERLQRAISYIEQNLPNSLYLDDIARQACLSKYHFCRLFKKHVGTTPIQFMLNKRINRAKLLLGHPDFTISSVAIRTGFSDLSEFNKQFRKATGVTPSSFRKSAALRTDR
jgi:AraC-like DNA-binding protein